MPSYSFKKIENYTDEEIELAKQHAILYCSEKNLDFYKILNGIDAYFEQRKRKQAKEASK
jgi:hypothetical protein